MIWPFRRKSKKRMARIVIDEPITSSTRVSVLKALKQVEDREFPALIVRIDSPGGTVGDSQEIYSAIKRIKDKGLRYKAYQERSTEVLNDFKNKLDSCFYKDHLLSKIY